MGIIRTASRAGHSVRRGIESLGNGIGGWLAHIFRPRRPRHFKPLDLEDPVAEIAQWKPRNRGGAPFPDVTLHRRGSIMEYHPSIVAIVIHSFAGVVGAVGIGVSVQYLWAEWLFIGLVLATGVMLWGVWPCFRRREIFFDKSEGLFHYHSRPFPILRMLRTLSFDLKSIYAIQILEEEVAPTGKHSPWSYWSYELNLVLFNGKRYNVIDHRSRRRVQRDAERLGEFLGVPVWDATLREWER